MEKNYINIIRENPYSLDKNEKNIFFQKKMNDLTKYHYSKSNIYKQILNGLNYKEKNFNLEQLPFITTNLFKELDLLSIESKKIFKILSSSGTSGSKTSKIYLDKENSIVQRNVLNRIFEYNFGNKRMPMLIVSSNPNINRNSFDAKTAAILGFSMFGTNHTYIINKKGEVDLNEFERFMEKYSEEDFLIFGFTHEVFQTFFDKIKKNNKYDLRNGILIHGGGWKKLKNKKISNEKFKKNFLKEYNLNKVFNYYGLIEQIGSIFFECPVCSLFVCSNFSEIFIRDKNLNIIKNGKGFVQLLSLLPKSYPGHNILTEDIGEIIQNPNCKFDHKGKCFKIHGRVENSVIRGCSDV